MPYERSFESQSPTLALAAILLIMIGITDIITLSLPEEIALVHHWGAQGKHSPPPPFQTTTATAASIPFKDALVVSWKANFEQPRTAPLRFLFSFALSAYAFLFSASSPLYREGVSVRDRWMSSPGSQLRSGGAAAVYNPSGWGGDFLKNRIFFAFMFVEMVSWLWVWVTLREEKREIAIKKAKRRGSQSYGY